MKKLVIIAVVLLTLTLSADWSEADKDAFMQGCVTEGAKYSLCKCAMDFLQGRCQIVNLVNMQDMQDAVKACTEAK